MGLVMKKFRYPFFESKMSFFPFICRFITMKTVVIAMTRDFMATKTVASAMKTVVTEGLPASLKPGSLYVPYSCTIPKQDPDIRLSGS